MASFLVVYGTVEGQTQKVAERIGRVVEENGGEATTVEAGSEPSVRGYDAVIIGSAVHYEKHHPDVRRLVSSNAEALREKPTAFFQISLSSAVGGKGRAEAAGYADAFLEDLGWNPDRIGFFGGALRYSKYGFVKRLMMKRIAKDATGDTDTSRDYEYTDWGEVERFASDFMRFAERRLM
ncbi:protoporphyrinogen oxidase [Haladaptatus sp. F3-133]|jgi:menaquinone-dependent protoporphyrinogen oxidase|uniref:Protoporphyrinogen oxidase n=1 Tax=Halorutilus salinus TaxID=2487751 RepID=A0A9Q4C3A7_9EURY|nr:flavodoxin domain-containing protein [Halorutilus salinus]MCX2818276.1 protoporphyrinogen oxidase [Halorutilus salinus]